eukprot:c8143_g1_i1.p1 GENE.c8143_g1_i1~~c8143_g1_i1.p1  ORF type:complete len:497 (+),score=111.32 c8143_g1_i1:40-1530(+)
MGLKAARFAFQPVDPTLVCPLCHDVIEMPTTIIECQHCFCKECVSNFLATHNACPACRMSADIASLCPANDILTKINSLPTICCYQSRGCQQTPPLASLAHHESECDFAISSCGNSSCPFSINGGDYGALNLRDLQEHSEVCGYRVLSCSQLCGQTVLASQLPQHIADVCENTLLECSLGCGAAIPRTQFDTHAAECSAGEVACVVPGCEYKAKRGNDEIWREHAILNAPQHNLLIAQEIRTAEKRREEGTKELWEEIRRKDDSQKVLESTLELESKLRRELQDTLAEQAKELEAIREQFRKYKSETDKMLAAQQSIVVSLERQLTHQSLEASIACTKLFQARPTASRSVVWVMDEFSAKLTATKDFFSPELSFSCSNPGHRYSFILRVSVCDEEDLDIFFIPVPGPCPERLEWPIRNHIRMTIFNHVTHQHQIKTISNTEDEIEYFATHAPPAHNQSMEGCLGVWLRKNHIESQQFVMNDRLVVVVELLDQLREV